MLQQFLNHIEQHSLCARSAKVLLAVSGGLDSMVMLHLFNAAGFEVGVAHCNFQLRGKESDDDEAWVRSVCERRSIPFHLQRFETLLYSQEKGVSIQMAARELRYNFFQELAVAVSYSAIATAHHINDSLETLLLNLVRGTGLDGLTGIAVRSTNVIRPMLFASRSQLAAYAKANQIAWREDSSNITDNYHRNLIRNQVVSRLKEINPNLEDGIVDTLERLAGARSLVTVTVEAFKKTASRYEGEKVVLDRQKLFEYPFPAVLLWEILKPYGFNYVQCKDIIKCDHTGRKFLSANHRLTCDRATYIVSAIREAHALSVLISLAQPYAEAGRLRLELVEAEPKHLVMQKDPDLAQLDLEKLQFPLTWRRWSNGDHFYPLGMQHRKKLSDFLIDHKVALPDKENITVLESGGAIVWVVGFRIDERFKITEQTKKVLVIRVSKV